MLTPYLDQKAVRMWLDSFLVHCTFSQRLVEVYPPRNSGPAPP